MLTFVAVSLKTTTVILNLFQDPVVISQAVSIGYQTIG